MCTLKGCPPVSPLTLARGRVQHPALAHYQPGCSLFYFPRRWLSFTPLLWALSSSQEISSSPPFHSHLCSKTHQDIPVSSFKMEHPTANSFPLSPVVPTAGVGACALHALQCGLVLATRREGNGTPLPRLGERGCFHLTALSVALICSTAVLQDTPSCGNIHMTRNRRRPLSNNSPGLTLPTTWW